MELRSFGTHKKRTWYSSRPFAKRDYIAIAVVVLLFLASLWITIRNGSRFYNPFM